MRPALVLLVALSVATGAPLPFPKPTRSDLKALQGEWRLLTVTTGVEDVGGGLTNGGPITAFLSVSVKGDRLRLSFGGYLDRDWTVTPGPEKGGGGLTLTRREGRASDGSGNYRPDGSLLLRLVAEDAGLTSPYDPPERRKAAVQLLLRRKVETKP